ncbi:MAG: glycosyltransferase [Acidobacteriia bacterium]|nr:glycosyltransferase [Terriglobia bacterium]
MTAVVSVVVPVYNGERTLADCLRALQLQDLAKSDYEVIVVCDGSTDSSATIAEGFNVRLLNETKRKGAPSARNVGFRAARGRWVAFTDHDCIPSRSWLRWLLQAVQSHNENEKPLGAGGKTLGIQSNSSAARFVDLAGGIDAEYHLKHPKFPFAPTANVMYLREALETVGGFDERYYSYDGCDLHYRLLREFSGPFYLEPRGVVFHRHRENWLDYCRQQFAHGQGFGQFFLNHGDQVEWSLWRELSAWGDLAKLGLRACSQGNDDEALVRRGSFLKDLAQRLGFITTYWNRRERRRW